MKSSRAPSPRTRRVLWSLDAFEEKSEMRNHVVAALKYLLHRLPQLHIDPVYVLSPDELDLEVEFSAPWLKQYRPAAEKALTAALEGLGFPRIKPQVVVQRNPSLSGSVQAVLKQAAAARSDLIVTGTHARHGLDRWMLGSFTETLLLQSQIPLLVVGPESQSLQRDHILFSTDLSPQSGQAFKRLLPLAKDLRAKVTILNVVPQPLEPVIQSGIFLMGGGWVPVGDFLSGEEERKRKVGARWVEDARKAGVTAEFVLDRGLGGSRSSISSVILGHARSRQAGMLAMAAQSGSVAATLLGSVTRQVVRQAPCPVWIWRPSKRR